MSTTNYDYYESRCLADAKEAYHEECKRGYPFGFDKWLDSRFVPPVHEGHYIENGDFVSVEKANALINRIEAGTVTGYLLEFQDNDGNWIGREFDPDYDTNLWNLGDEICGDFIDNDTQVGFFTALGDVWLSKSDDWFSRLGVNFYARDTPIQDPHESGIWGGVITEECVNSNELWRVRKVTIPAKMSEKAKAFFRKYPEVEMTFHCK